MFFSLFAAAWVIPSSPSVLAVRGSAYRWGEEVVSVNEIGRLENAIAEIVEVAARLGLDFFPMRFEICPADILYAFGAYGMPTRFAHWSFGKAFHRIKMEYDYNLSRIYEMVINTNPCYAFLLESNSFIQNKLVVAHVLGHSDFFKNNAYFAPTRRDMLETMAAGAARIAGYEARYGRKDVEPFLDAALAVQEHVNPLSPASAFPSHPIGQICAGCSPAVSSSPAEPERDLLLFIIRHGRELSEWQQDILDVVREESLYFRPQQETKILNEGWATYWHVRIMRELDLGERDALEFAKTHAGLIQASRFSLNPYLLGLRLLEDIERRDGREALFEVRTTQNDLSLIRNYLTEELVDELDLYVYRKVGYEWRVVEKNWEAVRQTILEHLMNGGRPYLVVDDGDFNCRGELYLRHSYEGVELDVPYLERTLPHVHRLWRRPVHLETVLDGKKVLFSYQGERVSKRFL